MSFFLMLLQCIPILLARVEWINDWLDIPVYSQIEDYKNRPEAKLYIDNYLVVGARVNYQRDGVEWTFMSTVNTAHVRAYAIKYRATFPDHGVVDVQVITFNIVDLISPEIHDIAEKTIVIGEKLPDFTVGVIVTDNYYDVADLMIYVDTTKVVLSKVGSYSITYRISDPSGNVINDDVLFHIIDPLPPVITLTKVIKLDIKQTFIWQNYMTVKDQVDSILYVSILDQAVNYSEVGFYVIEVVARDQSGNEVIETFEIEIADLSAPIIKLKSSPPNIQVFTDISRALLESYILEISDNYDAIEISDVKIMHDIEPNALGRYSIYYEIVDSSNNLRNEILYISVVDTIKPSINLRLPLVFDVFDVEPFWGEHFHFEDNFTSKDLITYKIIESVKMDVVGRYPITVEATDGSLNKAIYQDYIEIVDRISPQLMQLNEIVITNFEKKSYTHYFHVSDQYDTSEKINLSIDDSGVDYSTIGSYVAYAIASDTSGNETVLTFEIMVVDIIEPTLEISVNTYYHEIEKGEIDLNAFIVAASDNYDMLSMENVIIEHEISWSELGRYEVMYSLSDGSMNTIEKTLYFIVDDRIPPSIIIEDIEIIQGEIFDIWMGVEIDDNYGNPTLYVLPHDIDTSNPGTHILTYIVIDSRGNYTMRDRLLTVQSNDSAPPIEAYLPIAVLTLMGSAVLYILYKKR